MAPKTVLVVDDHADSRLICSHLLGFYGYNVLLAADCAEAMRLATEHRPELVLMDFLLPDANGLDAVHELRKNEDLRDTRFVLYTAAATQATSPENTKDVDMVLLKPVETARLIEVVRDMIGLAEAEPAT